MNGIRVGTNHKCGLCISPPLPKISFVFFYLAFFNKIGGDITDVDIVSIMRKMFKINDLNAGRGVLAPEINCKFLTLAYIRESSSRKYRRLVAACHSFNTRALSLKIVGLACWFFATCDTSASAIQKELK